MRKIMLSMLLCLSLVLATSALADAAQPDVDLTNLDTVDAIDELYAMADAPEANQGKVVRLTGYFAYSNWGDGEFLLLSGGASCCASQIEFVPAEAPEDPEQLTLSDEPITVQGVLDIYDNDGYDDVRLIEAQIEREAL